MRLDLCFTVVRKYPSLFLGILCVFFKHFCLTHQLPLMYAQSADSGVHVEQWRYLDVLKSGWQSLVVEQWRYQGSLTLEGLFLLVLLVVS